MQKTVITAVASFAIIGGTALAITPSAEANQQKRELRRENRQLRRVVRHDRRDWNRYRRNSYSNGRFGGTGPFVLPTPMDMDTGMDQGITVLQA